MNHITFEVEYYPTKMSKHISDAVSASGIGIDRVAVITKFTMNTSSNLNKKNIKLLSDELGDIIAKSDGEVINIKYLSRGKYELQKMRKEN